MDCSPLGASAHAIFQSRILEQGTLSTSGDLPDPGIEPASLVSPALAGGFFAAAAAAKLLQSCPTLCDPRDGSPPGSPVPGILQARTLEWLAIAFSNA